MKVLIVDDEAPARERLERLMHEIVGYEVAGEAANGMEAVQIFNRSQPEIVLLDIRMPVMDGIQLTRAIQERFTGMPVVLVTAHATLAAHAPGARVGHRVQIGLVITAGEAKSGHQRQRRRAIAQYASHHHRTILR